MFAAAAPKICGRPVLLDVHDLSTEVFASRHGSAPIAVRIAERLSLRFADHILTVHDDYLERIRQRGIAREDISVVLNTPDDRLFPLTPPRPPTRTPRLIYHGTFVARYGLSAALHAVAAVRHRVPGVRLELVGDGDFRPEIVRLVGELGLASCVELSAGALPVDEIPARIGAADIGIVPFVDDPFTRAVLPTKLLEYVCAGLPVIVSRNPVIERYFTDDDVFFVQPGEARGHCGGDRTHHRRSRRRHPTGATSTALLRRGGLADREEAVPRRGRRDDRADDRVAGGEPHPGRRGRGRAAACCRAADGIRQAAVRGVGWSLIQSWGGRIASTAAFVVLARTLEPSDFGVVALAVALHRTRSTADQPGIRSEHHPTSRT